MNRYRLYDHYGKFMGCNITPCDCKANAPKRYGGHELKWRVLFILDKNTILEDIGNLAYSQGDASRIEDPDGHLMHQYFDIIEDGNIKRVDRTINMGLNRCERLLHKWTKNPLLKRHFSMDNNQYNEKNDLLMEIMVGDGFSETIAVSLMGLINEFVEVYVLRDWAGITYKEGYDYWNLRLLEIEEQITNCLELGEEDEDAIIYTGW